MVSSLGWFFPSGLDITDNGKQFVRKNRARRLSVPASAETIEKNVAGQQILPYCGTLSHPARACRARPSAQIMSTGRHDSYRPGCDTAGERHGPTGSSFGGCDGILNNSAQLSALPADTDDADETASHLCSRDYAHSLTAVPHLPAFSFILDYSRACMIK